MCTPESKLESAAAKVSSDLSKAKSIWASYEVYIVAAVCLIVGAIVGHKI